MNYHFTGAVDASNVNALASFLAAHSNQAVQVSISSDGGSLPEALRAYNAIKQHGNVTTIADGITASAATLILFAGATIRALRNSLLMFHLPSASVNGNASDLQAGADALKSAEQLMRQIYGTNADTLLSSSDTWYTAEQASELGLVQLDDAQISAFGQFQIAAQSQLSNGNGNGAPSFTQTVPVPTNQNGNGVRLVPNQVQTTQLLGTHNPLSRANAASDGILIRAGLLKDQPSNEFRSHTLTQIRNAVGVDDFPNVLSDAANKAMGVTFEQKNEVWQQICETIEVDDFKEVSLSSLSLYPTPERTSEHGEITIRNFADTGETGNLETDAAIFQISRRAIVNDDLMQLARIAEAMAEASARGIGDELARAVSGDGIELSDGEALFANSRDNTLSSVPSSDSLDEARTKLALTKDPAGIVSGAMPQWIWTPVGLQGTISAILASENHVSTDPDMSDSTAPNRARNMLSPENVLGDYRLDGEDAAAWYLLGMKQFVRLALRGNTSPMLDNERLFHTDGYAWRVLNDYAIVPTGSYRIVRGNNT